MPKSWSFISNVRIQKSSPVEFDSPLIKGKLIKRYKRFLADITLESGEFVTAHSPNTGSMKGCSDPGSTVWLRDTRNPDRKYPLSWEMVETTSDVLVGINTLLSNSLVAEAISNGTVAELSDYAQIKREVKYGQENSRIDLLLLDQAEQADQADQADQKPNCYVEVKNVTLLEGTTALFPDAVTKRGSKHLRELQTMVEQGYRAVIFYCIQRNDANEFRPADDIDPIYGQLLRESINAGVEAIAYSAELSSMEIKLVKRVPVVCP